MRRSFGAWLLFLAATAPAQQDLETLVEQLGGADHNARNAAYQELQRRRDPAMVPLIGRGIEAFERGGQQYAIYLLRAQPIDVTRAVYRDLLGAKLAFLRVAAAAELARRGEPRAIDRLVAALGETPDGDRVSVLSHLYSLDDARYHDAILAWLHPKAQARVVRAVLQHLVRQDKVDSAVLRRTIEPLTANPDPEMRVAVLAYLARFDPVHGKTLAALLRDDITRFWAVRDLLDTERKLGGAMIEVMAMALAEPRSKYDVTRVAAMLQRQSPGSAVAELRGLLRHEKTDYRAAALEALANLPGGLESKDLQALLRDDEVETRLVAAATLRRRDDPSGLPVVLELLPNAGRHKAEAVRVLAAFRHRKVAPVLLDLLDDGDLQVRRAAWTGLQGLMRDLFPYRRFDFAASGYVPEQASRGAAIATLRAWWTAVQ